MEDWRKIPTFPNYEISNQGLIRNIETNNILKHININGCKAVYLSYKKKFYGRSINKLYKEVFGVDLNKENRVKSFATYRCKVCGKIFKSVEYQFHKEECKPLDKNKYLVYG